MDKATKEDNKIWPFDRKKDDRTTFVRFFDADQYEFTVRKIDVVAVYVNDDESLALRFKGGKDIALSINGPDGQPYTLYSVQKALEIEY